MSDKPFRPLLASSIKDLEKLEFPLIASPKLDGFRCLIHPELGPVTRQLKPIANTYVREQLNRKDLVGFDGELMIAEGFSAAQKTFAKQSDEEVEFEFHVFDDMSAPDRPYNERRDAYVTRIVHLRESAPFLCPVPTVVVPNLSSLDKMHRFYVKEGFEGIMLRKREGHYKFGRSTFNEHILLKHKDFHEDEAAVVGIEQRYMNDNDPMINALGLQERSTKKDGKVPVDMIGALVLKWRDTEFKVGSGFTHQQAKEMWNDRDDLIGQLVTFQYQEVGSLGRPRFPTFRGIRRDL